jgi:hypothetical protein
MLILNRPDFPGKRTIAASRSIVRARESNRDVPCGRLKMDCG